MDVPIVTRNPATPPATPELTSAVPIPKAHATVMYTSQLMESLASCSDMIPKATMRMLTTKAHTSSDATPAVALFEVKETKQSNLVS